VLVFARVGYSSKIRFLLPLASKSHVHVFEPLIRGLGESGHEIVSFPPIISSNMPPNVQQIPLITVDDLTGPVKDVFEQRKHTLLQKLTTPSVMDHVFAACEKVLRHPKFYEVIYPPNSTI